MRRLDTQSRSLVRELQRAINAPGSKGAGCADNSFVGLLLKDAKQRGEEISEDYLRDAVMNFLFAGRDSTAATLAWTVYCLTQHPEIQAKARHEVVSVCGAHGPNSDDM